MLTRRTIMASMLGAVVMTADVWAADDDLPKAKIVKGKPPVLDFGEGLQVPCDKGAFLTLWEGQNHWLTFGFGSAGITEIAQSRAIYHAEGAMRYLLLTLAFAPDRLIAINGHGWRQKEEKASNYVMGDLELPGRASRPLDDVFLGRGNVSGDTFWGQPGVGGMMAGPSSPGGGPDVSPSGMMPSMTPVSVNAFCCYIVKKKDLSLNDVRLRAKILKI